MLQQSKDAFTFSPKFTFILLIDSSKFVAKREERQAKLKKVSKKDADGLVPDYDSDEDYSQHKFEINEKLDYK